MKQFDITFFDGPFAEYIVKDDVVADIAASGITLVPLTYNTAVNKEALLVLRRFGLRAIVRDERITELFNTDNVSGADVVVKDVVADYDNFDNLIGWEIVDEPHASKFTVLSAIVNAFRRYSPEKETVINLYPNYASEAQLGMASYADYLESYVNVVRPHLISYDHYHFLGREKRNENLILDVDERERLIRLSAEKTEDRPEFFENIELIRATALKYDVDPMLIILLTEHGPYRNLTIGELYWEVNMSLAYGMKRLSYYTYWELAHDVEHWQWANAMCDTKGNKMQHWYDAQTINSVIAPVARHLFNTKTEAVFHIGTAESCTRKFEGYKDVTSILGQNGVIGFFEDGSIYLVNRDFICKNTFTLNVQKPLSVFKDNVFVKSDCTTFELGPGEAVLLKI